MRHRERGRVLGRKSDHRKAMFRNMAASLIKSVRIDEEDTKKPKVAGRITTTVAKAKELRPYIEKLVTLAVKALKAADAAEKFAAPGAKGSTEWTTWRKGEGWQKWNQAVAPAVAYRRRAFAELRDNHAVDILFTELAQRFEKRPGGYTRIVKLAEFRLGDAGKQALIEFVGNDRDRKRQPRKAPLVTREEAPAASPPASEAPAAAPAGQAT